MNARAASSAEDACEGADVVVTATYSKTPVIPSNLSSDTLIVAMGGNMANRTEVPPELVRRARVIVDDVEQCKLEAGELLQAGIDWNDVETLGAVAVGKAKAGEGRRLLLFKSVGIGLEDVAAAAYVYETADSIPALSSADPSPATR
jgi:ornithine cyclodeaminase/alanine dehydrogenase-like protein (mu-crystallin family)